MKSKHILLCLITIIVICLFSFYNHFKLDNYNSSGQNISGTFSGSYKGENGNILLDVVIKENVITHIELLSHTENPGFNKAIVQLTDDIITSNSLDVDIVSGATLTSTSFIKAVEDALKNSGINPSDLKDVSTITTSKDDYLTNNCDILIIGGGGAGLSAAIEASSTSECKVILLEKMSFAGGNTRMSGGEYAAPGNWVQLNEGILDDSIDTFFNDIYYGGKEKGNPELIKVLAENALTNAFWLRDFVGVKYKDTQSWYGGHSYSRTLWPEGDGPKYVDTLISKAVDLGVEFHYNTKANQLLKDGTGRVIGVRAVRNGKIIDYVAQKGVILTTGGFGSNIEMREEYNTVWPTLDESIPTTNSPAIVGDGIKMAEELGANIVNMESIQLYPINNPATGNYYFLDYARLNSNAILVNKHGNRFVNEKETRDNLSASILKQPDSRAFEIIDSTVIKKMNLKETYSSEISKGLAQKVLTIGTLEECADFFDIPYDSLIETAKKYNSYSTTGIDEDFGRTSSLEPVDINGEFIMFAGVVSVHHTMGGVDIDKNARVLDINKIPIPGLYAAGEVTGSIHGGNRLGSLSMPDTVTFGRIAARSAVNMY